MRRIAIVIAFILISSAAMAKTPWSSKPPISSQIDWSHPLSRGLVGCWLMNEGGGLKVEDLARNNNGSLLNAPTWNVGTKGKRIKFVAASAQYISLGNPAILQITGSITIVTHYFFTGTAGDGILVAKDKDTGGRAYTFDISTISVAPNKGVRFYINGGSATDTNIAVENRTPVAGDTRQVVGVYDQSIPKCKLYVNGKFISQSVTTDTSIPTATANVLIARREYSGFTTPLDGSIYYVYIYNRALSPSEIQQLYQEPYCFIKPQTDWVYYKTTAAGGGYPFQVIMIGE